jgi:hypothetical protein
MERRDVDIRHRRHRHYGRPAGQRPERPAARRCRGHSDKRHTIVTAAATGGPEQNWVDTCGYPLEPILMQPPVAFPVLDQTAYDYASETVDPPIPAGTQPDYASMTSGVAADYAQHLNDPTEVPAETWSATVSQLQAELTT